MVRSLVVLVAVAGTAAAQPFDPHGSGHEPPPVDREFHLAPRAAAAFAPATASRPTLPTEDEVRVLVRVLLPWAKGV
jgi:hypothetical protein